MGLKDLFKKHKKEESNEGLTKGYDIPFSHGIMVDKDKNEVLKHQLFASVVMMNDGVDICAEACSACWDTKLPDGYEGRSKYIGKRAKTGHTSILEHSNLVLYMNVPIAHTMDLLEVFGASDFIHSQSHFSEDKEVIYVLIGGSWRAYSDLFKKVKNDDNVVLSAIRKCVYSYIPSDAMKDLIDLGILEQDQFDLCNTRVLGDYYKKVSHYDIDEDLNINNIDDLNKLTEYLSLACPEPDKFKIHELLPFCTITVQFKHMSRIITQQLTRHRNAITQESQRYVDYSKAGFNSPAKFKDKYSDTDQYYFTFGGTGFKMTLQEIGDNIISIYNQLTDPSINKVILQKEDARAFLPGNTQCGSIYITFTWKFFFMFLKLREDKGAQAEIRSYAKRLGDYFRSTYPEYSDTVEATQPLSVIDDQSIWSKHVGVTAPEEETKSFEEIVEIMEEHVKNFDEDKLDPIEEEPGTTKLKPGEM